ncbi:MULTISPECIES: RagB/SusD family nutrient uptake outer membrane protein [Bacteroides]|jgi:tetratricopeptide (TPR) repeat protein|uniref:RagB/SusD family nutrient uptake outer membrane protein n=1 Tax=Bacteroides TaxID=816 RepID=UPI000E527D31|nr:MULTISPECIES: RagB/SusD family nutrient uptake outer membrane protein [Bacteroides]RHL03220.1 RagB/SusD family nutrient uptake outer membrane protein [Bacteroides sp. AF39-11AC]
MKRFIQKHIFNGLVMLAGASIVFTSCKESFLDADPLSFYEPTTTFSTEAGLKSVLAIADRQLKRYWTDGDSNEMFPLMSEYTFSDLMVPSATDKTDLLDNVAQKLTINSDQSTLLNLNRVSTLWFFWQQTYEGIRNANTILTYIDNVTSLSDDTKNIYIGRAYFHRAFRYYLLTFQYGNVPLMTKILEVPKLNFRSTKRDAILDLLVQNMEFAVKWVPDQKDMDLIGMVNKGACRMLLSKLYLAVGEYEKAKEQLDILINNSGYSLMTDNFGTFNDGGVPETWSVTRNVIWDLHRPENKLISTNKEVIMGMPNRGAASESFLKNQTMRILYPFYFNNMVTMPDGKQALLNIKRNSADYNGEYDYMRAMGRGISTCRPTWFYQKGVWAVNGKMDETDLRHSVEAGNWVTMESLKCNNKASSYFGQPLRLYDDNGKLLCADTIRRWYDVPHYIFKLDDPVNEANISGSDGNRGATDGSNADWYLYRLAEAYLLRAEAKFYINPNDATIKDDLNIIRERAHCSQLYEGNVTIGDIMNERARELFWEEFRNVELTRVSLCLARSGRPDEWGNTYDINTFDKQEGTDLTGGSYWYQRCIHQGMYNKGVTLVINATKSNLDYIIDKKNIYWPIPEKEIKANNKGQLWQNYGYTGYDPSIPVWETWEESVADESKID